MRDKTEAAPLKERPQLHGLAQSFERARIAAPGNGAGILILNFNAPVRYLFEDHVNRLQNVERLESADHDRLAIVARDEFIGTASDYRRDVAGPDEAAEPQVGRIEDRLDRRNDSHVIAEDRKIFDSLSFRAQYS